ncbi:MAG TPA: SAV_915 family protein [Trebonia sp.]|nr:SAV_915 family protein [Trebonia sp.]
MTGTTVLYVLACPVPEGKIQSGQAARDPAVRDPAVRSVRPGYLLHEVGGVPCVIGYTGLDELVECCGEFQPWVAIPMDALMADLRDQRLPGPVVNLPLDEAVRWLSDGPPWDLAGLASDAGQVAP